MSGLRNVTFFYSLHFMEGLQQLKKLLQKDSLDFQERVHCFNKGRFADLSDVGSYSFLVSKFMDWKNQTDSH